jgi:hypothetical protein
MKSPKSYSQIVSRLGFIGGAIALALLALALVTRGSQAIFQVNRPAAEYAALLLQRAATLRVELAVDFVFIGFYAAFFVYLAQAIQSWRGTRTVAHPFWLGALLLTALLDAIENAHILSLLSLAEQGLAIPQGDIAWQMAASQLKFVASYLGLFLLSFELPEDTRLERALVVWLRWFQFPLGVAIFVVPAAAAVPLVLLRVVSFVAGLWIFAWVGLRRGEVKG